MQFRRIPLALLLVLPLAACGDDSTDDGSTAVTGTTDTGTTDTGGSDTSEPDADQDDTGAGDATADTTVDTGGADTGGEDTDETPPTLDEIYTTIFEPSCSQNGCHGDSASGGLDLKTRDGLRDRLLADSITVDFPLVTPSSLDDSYLWHKIMNTQGDVGGIGTRMPVLGLPDEEIALIEAWILAGAPE